MRRNLTRYLASFVLVITLTLLLALLVGQGLAYVNGQRLVATSNGNAFLTRDNKPVAIVVAYGHLLVAIHRPYGLALLVYLPALIILGWQWRRLRWLEMLDYRYGPQAKTIKHLRFHRQPEP